MIHNVAEAFSNWLEKEGVVPTEKCSLYTYAVYSFLFGTAPLVIVIILGTLMGMLREGLLLIMPFMLIRKFSGGYHLQSVSRCFVTSNLLIILALCAIKLIIYLNGNSQLTYVVLLAIISICLCSPIDNEARKLSEKEAQLFGRITQMLTIVTLIAYLVLQYLSIQNCAVPIGVGIVLVAGLQLPCVITKKRKSDF